jgi:uncharacterized protein YndB with AHSA1/START domain
MRSQQQILGPINETEMTASKGDYEMHRVFGTLGAALILLAASARIGWSEARESHQGGFIVEQELVLPASPDDVYDAVTGDISGWWDHSFSKAPKKLYIEAKPGGGFYEIFNDAGDGVLHATVNYAERGKRLIFTGPLGSAGHAMEFVVTYELKPDPAGTRLHLTCSASGEVEEGWNKGVDSVWHHFLFERLKPYIESGEYRKKKPAK